ncbi:MAG: hypothetical protein ACR2HY_11460, partial [Acidimicrobiales bacterium]
FRGSSGALIPLAWPVAGSLSHMTGILGSMIMPASVRFAAAARILAAESRRRGLVVAGFRSPPRHPNAWRTMRRRSDSAVVVAVRLRGRPFEAVAADMVEGVVVANRLSGSPAAHLSAILLAAVLDDDAVPAA